jgi:hypothetical protein
MNWAEKMWRGIGERLAANHEGFWRAYRVWIFVFLAALLCDMASTMWFMREDGVEMELHFFVRLASRLLGPVGGPAAGFLGKAVAGMLVAIYCRKYAVYIFAAGTVISVWAAWYNVWGRCWVCY